MWTRAQCCCQRLARHCNVYCPKWQGRRHAEKSRESTWGLGFGPDLRGSLVTVFNSAAAKPPIHGPAEHSYTSCKSQVPAFMDHETAERQQCTRIIYESSKKIAQLVFLDAKPRYPLERPLAFPHISLLYEP